MSSDASAKIKFEWIYAVTCSLYEVDGVFKLGYTTTDTDNVYEAEDQLRKRYGTSLIGIVVKTVLPVSDGREAERTLFSALNAYRSNPRREFFRGDFHSIIFPAMMQIGVAYNRTNTQAISVKSRNDTEPLILSAIGFPCRSCGKLYSTKSNAARHTVGCNQPPTTLEAAIRVIGILRVELGEKEAGDCVTDTADLNVFGEESLNHINSDFLDSIRVNCDAENAICKVTELIYFSPSAPQNRNVYLASSKNATVEMFDGSGWVMMPRFKVLDRMLSLATTTILREWTSSMNDVDSDKISRVMEANGDEHSQVRHRTKQLLWALVVNHGKRRR